MLLLFCAALASISIGLTLGVSSGEAEILWNVRQNYYHQSTRPAISQSFMETLDSIVSNDVLHCVPRLLCELTSGQTQTSKDLALPLNINAESLFGLISGVNSPSPIVTFAKAALLGFTSKGNITPCYQAYSTCPKDPDKLMQYLNNYNGGFFRLFSGTPKPSSATKRILNNHHNNDGDKFTFHAGLRSPKILTFPYDKATVYHRPAIGHVKVPMVFPDRTGTGELKLDADELNNELYGDYNKLKFNQVFRFPV